MFRKTNEPNLKKMKKNNFFFGPGFGTNLGLKFFLQVLPLLIIRHCSKPLRYAIYRKTNTPNLRKLQKKPPNFGPDFGLFDPNLGLQIFF